MVRLGAYSDGNFNITDILHRYLLAENMYENIICVSANLKLVAVSTMFLLYILFLFFFVTAVSWFGVLMKCYGWYKSIAIAQPCLYPKSRTNCVVRMCNRGKQIKRHIKTINII